MSSPSLAPAVLIEVPFTLFPITSNDDEVGAIIVTNKATGSPPADAISLQLICTASFPTFSDAPVIGSVENIPS